LLVRHAPEHAARVLLRQWLDDASAARRSRIEDALRLLDAALVAEEAKALQRELDEDQAQVTAVLLERLQAAPIEEQELARLEERSEEVTQQVALIATDELPELLHHPNHWVRAAAATQLAERGQTAALPEVIDALAREASASWYVAQPALAAAVHRLGGDAVVQTLFSRIHDNVQTEVARVPGPWPEDLEEGAVPDSLREALGNSGFSLTVNSRVTRVDGRWTVEDGQSVRTVWTAEGEFGAPVVRANIEEHDDWLIVYAGGSGVELLRAVGRMVAPGAACCRSCSSSWSTTMRKSAPWP
jgi:hypothetical protein